PLYSSYRVHGLARRSYSNAKQRAPHLNSRNGRLWNVRLHQSALAPDNLTTLPHFSVSSAMSLPKSAGEPGRTVPPRLASCALNLGLARPALISLLSLSIICGGVFLGAPTPYHWLASKPGRNSPIVAIPGSVSERVAVVTASARSVPALMYSIDAGRELNMTCTSPPSRSVAAGATPR